jgi:hypothetical protein
MISNNKYKVFSIFFTIFIVTISILVNAHFQAFGEEDNKKTNTSDYKGSKKQNSTLPITGYNFIAVGDWYCNAETKKTINNILAVNPELIIKKETR